MNAFHSLRRLIAGLSAAMLFALTPAAQADNVDLADASGTVGSTVSVRLFGDVNMLFGGELFLAFDGLFLTFTGTSVGNMLSAYNPGTGQLVFNLPDPGGDLGMGVFNYVDLFFTINVGAMGTTSVKLGDGSNLFFGIDGDTERLVAGLDANVSVLDLLAVPIGSTGPLVLSALAALVLTRRRAPRSAGATSQLVPS